jgi:hypothetical protein
LSSGKRGLPQAPERKPAAGDPNQRDGGIDQFVIDQEVNDQRDSEHQQKSPVPPAAGRFAHGRILEAPLSNGQSLGRLFHPGLRSFDWCGRLGEIGDSRLGEFDRRNFLGDCHTGQLPTGLGDQPVHQIPDATRGGTHIPPLAVAPE